MGAALPGADPERCAALVLATAGHGGAIPADDPDLASFLDCDLSILGAAPDRYDRYEADVAREYLTVVTPEAYRAGRASFLASMAGRTPTFHTAWLEERLGERARSNLRRALAAADPCRGAPRD
ncbi:MAG: hypothetical protein R3F59_37690 [Myxococcota bacterium]